jgi:hypothetical protein
MFAILALLFAASFLVVSLAIPFRFEARAQKVIARLRRLAFPRASEAHFSGAGELRSGWVRAWGVAAALLFGLFGALDGSLISNRLDALGAVALYVLLSAGASALAVWTVIACISYPSRLLGYSALEQCGFRGIWIVDPKGVPASLRDCVEGSVALSERIRVVDVTGYEVLGKGPGRDGGLLYDALVAAPHVPASIFLLREDGSRVDPDRRCATVFQTALYELGLSVQTYEKRLQATLKAIEELNASRAREARIEVHAYREKPPFQAVLFDDSVLITAGGRREEHTRAYLRVAPSDHQGAPSFFEVFRKELSRLLGPRGPAQGLLTGGSGVLKVPAVLTVKKTQTTAAALETASAS